MTDPIDVSDAHTAKPELKGRKAIITGGTTGIGRAIAVLLASEGVDVFVCGRNEQHLGDALARIREVGTGDGVSVDLAEKEGIDTFFARAADYLGDWDIAVINAAIPAQGLTDMSEDDLRYAIAADFTAYLVCAHKAAAHLEDRGDIVFTGSYSTHKLGPSSTVYAGIKSGIHGFAEALRREVGQEGIKVSLLTPALTGADFHLPDPDAEEQAEKIRAEEMLRAEDIAVACHFVLTQPRRTIIQEVIVMQRDTDA